MMDPSTAPAHCVGPESPEAGLAPGCAGCPNAALCASGAARAPDPDLPLIHARLDHIKHTVFIMSGKGGVGKSSVSKEIAFALSEKGFRVGLLDTDLCGPSIPRVTGTRSGDCHRSGDGYEPVWLRDNLCVVSSHFFLAPEEKNEALMLRGPKKTALIKTMLKDVAWGQLDFLIVDTPPGTSDEHLTLVALFKDSTTTPPSSRVSGVVMVTTPQKVAEADVRRELSFCEKAHLPVLGIAENMSGFTCQHCHRTTPIFQGSCKAAMKSNYAAGGTAGERLSAEFGVPLLGKVPIDPLFMKSCEEGVPLLDLLGAQADAAAADSNNNQEGEEDLGAIAAIFEIADRVVIACMGEEA